MCVRVFFTVWNFTHAYTHARAHLCERYYMISSLAFLWLASAFFRFPLFVLTKRFFFVRASVVAAFLVVSWFFFFLFLWPLVRTNHVGVYFCVNTTHLWTGFSAFFFIKEFFVQVQEFFPAKIDSPPVFFYLLDLLLDLRNFCDRPLFLLTRFIAWFTKFLWPTSFLHY